MRVAWISEWKANAQLLIKFGFFAADEWCGNSSNTVHSIVIFYCRVVRPERSADDGRSFMLRPQFHIDITTLCEVGHLRISATAGGCRKIEQKVIPCISECRIAIWNSPTSSICKCLFCHLFIFRILAQRGTNLHLIVCFA